MGQIGEGFLKAEGKSIVDQDGNVILLKGTNLGGWLLQEEWMCPVKGRTDNNSTLTQMDTVVELTNRFGYEKAMELLENYQSNWITEDDFIKMSELKMNCVRVPFGWWNFLKPDSDGNCTDEWIYNDFNSIPGFKTLDWVIEMGKKYGLYIILDMHGCPGGQNNDHTSGSRLKCYLYDRPEYADMMEKLWVAIAERYKDEYVVAGYDIMNEAKEFKNATSYTDPRNEIYDRMINAIRGVDDKHIIFAEAIWELSYLPSDPLIRGWSNVVYSLHAYQWKAADYCKHLNSKIEERKVNVPIYIGEFFDTDFMQLCIDNGWSFTSWCYKGVSSRNAKEPYCIYYYDNSIFGINILPQRKANVSTDNKEKIKEKWGEALRTDSGHYSPSPAYDAWKALKY